MPSNGCLTVLWHQKKKRKRKHFEPHTYAAKALEHSPAPADSHHSVNFLLCAAERAGGGGSERVPSLVIPPRLVSATGPATPIGPARSCDEPFACLWLCVCTCTLCGSWWWRAHHEAENQFAIGNVCLNSAVYLQKGLWSASDTNPVCGIQPFCCWSAKHNQSPIN